MRYRLRTLLIVLALGPPVLAGTWFIYSEPSRRQQEAEYWKKEAQQQEQVAIQQAKAAEAIFDGVRASLQSSPPTATTAPLPPD